MKEDINELKKAIDRKLIGCEHLKLYYQDKPPEYVNVRCERDHKTTEIWDCIRCLRLTIDDKFTHEQLYEGLTVPVIASEEILCNGIKVSHIRLMTEVCPMGYVCEDCKNAGPDLYYYRYCEIHKVWVSQ